MGNTIEFIQQIIIRTVATHPAGHRLALIGGFRLRFLDQSVRASDDIDYHFEGDLVEKQRELLVLFRQRLLPEIRRTLQYQGSAQSKTGSDADSAFVKIIELAFWQDQVPYSRIEIPVELTRIVCADPLTVRTASGIIYATVSEADMIESKVLAVFNRSLMQHRDLVDIFLFENLFMPTTAKRLALKIQALQIPISVISDRLDDLSKHEIYHAKACQTIIETQLDPIMAQQIHDAGGARMLVRQVHMRLMQSMHDAGRMDRAHD